MKPGDPAAVEQLFDAVAPRYDRLNDVLSFGLHRQWKRQLVRALKPVAGEHWLDLCCGTGDLALELGRCVRPAGAVTGLDAAAAPLERARQRQQQQPWLPVTFQQGDALDTGLPSACADGAVMAYGLRNLADPLQGLKELRRLLKPAGVPGCWISTVCPRVARRLPFSASICVAWWCPLQPLWAYGRSTPTWKKVWSAFLLDLNRSGWHGRRDLPKRTTARSWQGRWAF